MLLYPIEKNNISNHIPTICARDLADQLNLPLLRGIARSEEKVAEKGVIIKPVMTISEIDPSEHDVIIKLDAYEKIIAASLNDYLRFGHSAVELTRFRVGPTGYYSVRATFCKLHLPVHPTIRINNFIAVVQYHEAIMAPPFPITDEMYFQMIGKYRDNPSIVDTQTDVMNFVWNLIHQDHQGAAIYRECFVDRAGWLIMADYIEEKGGPPDVAEKVRQHLKDYPTLFAK